MTDIVGRLNENIIADAFERKAIADGALCERLIRERKEAADTIEALRAENAKLREALKPLSEIADNHSDKRDDYPLYVRLLVGELRAARTAMGETE